MSHLKTEALKQIMTAKLIIQLKNELIIESHFHRKFHSVLF